MRQTGSLDVSGKLLNPSPLQKTSRVYFFLLAIEGQRLPCISFKPILGPRALDVVEYPGISF